MQAILPDLLDNFFGLEETTPMLNPNFEISRMQVMRTRFEICSQLRSPDGFWGGEFRNLVYETLAKRLGLPEIDIGVGKIPDFNHPLVQRLNEQLNLYDDEICKECTNFD